MKLTVPFVETVNSSSSIEALSLIADKLEKNTVGIVPWPRHSYKPKVSFAIAHGRDALLLKYFVAEQNIRAVHTIPNESVYKDSCVEFFISFRTQKEYYNFEFNCIGTPHVAFGANRGDRKLLPNSILRNIVTQSIIRTNAEADPDKYDWQLTLMIPLPVFYFHTFTSLSDLHGKANFYKCGDELTEPHYIAWNDIKTEHPDFHLSEFFGDVTFAGSAS